MNTQTHTNCADCESFGVIRPATVLASYVHGEGSETLCDSCASNRTAYFNIRPLETAKAARTHQCPDCGGTFWGDRVERCTGCWFKVRAAEKAAMTDEEAYAQYADNGLADTDGHFAPMDFEIFRTLRHPGVKFLPATPAYPTWGPREVTRGNKKSLNRVY